ncbi:unnamed protein product [Caenorhabditis sp. 36 PRJEB53466]|nr:unnamed protein product [Caenorhabditis sp. 36 PRJEB53466]
MPWTGDGYENIDESLNVDVLEDTQTMLRSALGGTKLFRLCRGIQTSSSRMTTRKPYLCQLKCWLIINARQHQLTRIRNPKTV